MSAFASLSLNNNAAAAVVFTPASLSENIATWFDDNAVFDAKRRVTMSVTLPKNGSQVVRVKQKVVIPIMDAVDTSLKVGEVYANVEFVIPKRASQTQRLDLRAFVQNLVANAVSTAAIDTAQGIY